MAGRVEFTPEASEDVAEAFSWYERQQSGLGPAFETYLDRAVAMIRGMPGAGSPVHRTLRRRLLGRFAFAVYDVLEEDVIVVRAVLHHRRDPRTWRRRG